MYFRKDIRMDRDRQSLMAEADLANRNSNRMQSDAAFKFWRGSGLSVRAATVVAAAGCQSLGDIRDLGWSFFLRQENCGNRTLQELSDLVGGWPNLPRKRGAWLRHTSDGALIDELRRRGIAVGSGEAR
jgi:hypothetical protein